MNLITRWENRKPFVHRRRHCFLRTDLHVYKGQPPVSFPERSLLPLEKSRRFEDFLINGAHPSFSVRGIFNGQMDGENNRWFLSESRMEMMQKNPDDDNPSQLFSKNICPWLYLFIDFLVKIDFIYSCSLSLSLFNSISFHTMINEDGLVLKTVEFYFHTVSAKLIRRIVR